jgi:hypothetical protein
MRENADHDIEKAIAFAHYSTKILLLQGVF